MSGSMAVDDVANRIASFVSATPAERRCSC